MPYKSFLEFAQTRRSIRKYEDKEIPNEDIEYFIKAAVSAPSGCNSQCWKFVAIKDKSMIRLIEALTAKKVEEILAVKGGEITDDYKASKRKMVGFFAKAPVIIAVFMTKAHFYDPIFISALQANGYNDKAIMDLFCNYDLLSIGAAVQNMLLAIHEKGYGACWMNEPAIAGAEINKLLGVEQEHKFISLIPIGVPAYMPKDKKMKDFDEIFTLIDE